MSSLATLDELAMSLGVTLDPQGSDGIRAQSFLDRASDLARLEATINENSVPSVVKGVVVQVAARAFQSGEGAQGSLIGDAGLRPTSTDGAIYLMRTEARLIRRAAGSPVIGSVQLESDYGLLTALPEMTTFLIEPEPPDVLNP